MAKEQTTGIVVGADGVEWTTLRSGRGARDASGSGRLDVPPASSNDDETPEEPLGELLKSAYTGRKKDVTVGLPTERLLLKVVSLPAVDDEELASMVELQVDKLSPFPVERMVVSHEVLRRGDQDCLVLIAAAQVDVADGVGAILQAAGVSSARIDAVALGWWQLLSDAGEFKGEGRRVTLIFDSGAPELIVSQDGVPLAIRLLLERGDMDDETFARETVQELEYSMMSLELEHGAQAVVGATVWHRGDAPGAMLAELEGAFPGAVGAKPLDPLPAVSEGIARRTAQVATAVLDLTPKAWKDADAARAFKMRMALTATAVILLWALIAGGTVGAVEYRSRELAALRAEAERLQEPAMQVRRMRRLVSVIRRYIDRSDSSLECLREVVAQMPGQAGALDLTSFSYRKGEEVKVGGMANTVDLVLGFKANLDNGDLFETVDLTGPRRDLKRRKEVFDLQLSLPGGDE